MIATQNKVRPSIEVIHPLFDEEEQKCSAEGLGRMAMRPSVRISLMLLRGYLIVMGVLLAYHMLTLSGAIK